MGLIVGVDEVGRGCWAGPLLVVATTVISELPDGLNDSKQLTKKQREKLLPGIKLACKIGEGWVQPEEIDSHGLTRAMRIGVSRALIALGASLGDTIIIDGNINYCPPEFTEAQAIIRADATHPVVSAASVYAKVTRDHYMANIASIYPNYQFEKHVGYGTKLHGQLLRKYGPSRIHRRSYKPIAALLGPST
jgi:ribonuclease HII